MKTYLDYASITPLDKKVEKVIQDSNKKFWANPSSLHTLGEEAKTVMQNARKEIAGFLHCRQNEIFFTSGGTESANIAIKGIVSGYKRKNNSIPHIITSSIEHPAVLETIKSLKDVEISFISPNEEGIINPESIKKEIKPNTVLVCLMHANNEIGTIQPVVKVGSIIKEYRKENKSTYPYFLVDACQSFLYENVSIERFGADIIFVDGIKIYGPRGVGVLAIKSSVEIDPVFHGGGQESGLRSGTENVPAILGLNEAMKIAVKLREKESERLKKLQDYFIKKIQNNFSEEIPESSLNGSKEYRLPNNINICFPIGSQNKNKIEDSEFLVIKLDTMGFAVSSASACNTLKPESSSYVVESLGKKDCANSSIRFSFGRETKKSDIDAVLKALKSIFK